MKNVGIFLGYAPNQHLRKEGLGRLLAFVIEGALKLPDVRISIAHPYWFRKEVQNLLADHRIDSTRIDFIVPDSLPYLLRLSRHYTGQAPRKRAKRHRINLELQRAKKTLLKLSTRLLTCNARGEALLLLGLLAVGGLLASVISVVLAPLLILALLVRFIFKQVSPYVWRVHEALRCQFPFLRANVWKPYLYKIILQHELQRLVDLINRRRDIQAWLVPTVFWNEANGIKARTVTVVPDVVFLEYPVQYGTPYTLEVFERQMKTIAGARHFITYSNYIRDEHLVRNIGLKVDKVDVIRHGRTSLKSYLTMEGRLLDPAGQKDRARALLRQYMNQGHCDNPYWFDMMVGDVPYIFYSSQARPNKNIMTLIKLVDWLNHTQGRNMRLILTCVLDHTMQDYIHRRGLEPYILTLRDVPSEVLAALNALAVLSVTPTMFEGGFPFTFCEAYSVGTPSLLSAIPVITEVTESLSAELQARTLFDPYDLEDLQAKTLWALDNRDVLFALQAELYNAYATWDEVARQYVSVLMNAEAIKEVQEDEKIAV